MVGRGGDEPGPWRPVQGPLIPGQDPSVVTHDACGAVIRLVDGPLVLRPAGQLPVLAPGVTTTLVRLQGTVATLAGGCGTELVAEAPDAGVAPVAFCRPAFDDEASFVCFLPADAQAWARLDAARARRTAATGRPGATPLPDPALATDEEDDEGMDDLDYTDDDNDSRYEDCNSNVEDDDGDFDGKVNTHSEKEDESYDSDLDMKPVSNGMMREYDWKSISDSDNESVASLPHH